jgi:hypothetical protein
MVISRLRQPASEPLVAKAFLRLEDITQHQQRCPASRWWSDRICQPALKAKILSYLIRIRDEFLLPILYVTHDLDEIRPHCE